MHKWIDVPLFLSKSIGRDTTEWQEILSTVTYTVVNWNSGDVYRLLIKINYQDRLPKGQQRGELSALGCIVFQEG